MKRIHVAKKATASEIRGSVGATSTHNRSAAKALQATRVTRAASGSFVTTHKGSGGKKTSSYRKATPNR